MTVPRNVWLFEVLLYASLTLDAVSVAFQDRTPTVTVPERLIDITTAISFGLIVLLCYLVWLAARRRKNWPRWVLAAALALSLVSLVQVIGANGLQFGNAIDGFSCLLTALGMYFAFTGDARDWFDG